MDYNDQITSLWPFTVIFLKEGYATPFFFWSTPSFLFEGDLVMLARTNNYSIALDGRYLWKEPFVETRNILYQGGMWHMLAIQNVTCDSNVRGIEDCRLIRNPNHSKRIFFTGVIATTNKHRRLVIGEIIEDSLCVEHIIESPYDAPQEKNWGMFWHPDGYWGCVYRWHPFIEVGRLASSKLVDLHILKQNLPYQGIRGSSHGIVHDGMQWFVVHSVTGSSRKYWHHVVVMDNRCQNVLYITPAFCFTTSNPVEFCNGFAIVKDKAYFGISTQDSTTRVLVLSLTFLKKSLIVAI